MLKRRAAQASFGACLTLLMLAAAQASKSAAQGTSTPTNTSVLARNVHPLL